MSVFLAFCRGNYVPSKTVGSLCASIIALQVIRNVYKTVVKSNLIERVVLILDLSILS